MKEVLYFIKETKNTVVYGNDTIQSIYLPKTTFKDVDYPEEIMLEITW